MTCRMGEFTRTFLWSSCDQCGATANFEYGKTNSPIFPDKFEVEEIRDEWNKHHRGCSTAKRIRVPVFRHERDDIITYV